jgi:ElaB/YqjD/DUF883 family membrane-anchored ribosome-binding protein
MVMHTGWNIRTPAAFSIYVQQNMECTMSDTTTQMPGSRTKPGADKTSFAHEAAHKASDMAEGAADKADAALEKGKQIAEVAGVQAKEARQMLVSHIKENPLAAVGIAFGAGMLIAILRK